MSTTETPAPAHFDAFVRIDPTVRDRLKEHCQAHGLVMGRWVSKIITRQLDAITARREEQNNNGGAQPAPAKPARRRKK